MPERADVEAVNSLSRQSKEKDHPVRAMGVLSAMVRIFNDTAMQARTLARAKAIEASPGPRVIPQPQAKEKVRKQWKNPKGSPKEPKVRSMFPKAQAKVNRQSGNEYGRAVCS